MFSVLDQLKGTNSTSAPSCRLPRKACMKLVDNPRSSVKVVSTAPIARSVRGSSAGNIRKKPYIMGTTASSMVHGALTMDRHIVPLNSGKHSTQPQPMPTVTSWKECCQLSLASHTKSNSYLDLTNTMLRNSRLYWWVASHTRLLISAFCIEDEKREHNEVP